MNISRSDHLSLSLSHAEALKYSNPRNKLTQSNKLRLSCNISRMNSGSWEPLCSKANNMGRGIGGKWKIEKGKKERKKKWRRNGEKGKNERGWLAGTRQRGGQESTFLKKQTWRCDWTHMIKAQGKSYTGLLAEVTWKRRDGEMLTLLFYFYCVIVFVITSNNENLKNKVHCR